MSENRPSKPSNSRRELPYTVERRGVAHKEHVIFNCPGCQEQLHARLARAGKRDKCALCNTGFTLPGAAHKSHREQADSAERRSRDEEDARRRAENSRFTEEFVAQRHAEATAIRDAKADRKEADREAAGSADRQARHRAELSTKLRFHANVMMVFGTLNITVAVLIVSFSIAAAAGIDTPVGYAIGGIMAFALSIGWFVFGAIFIAAARALQMLAMLGTRA